MLELDREEANRQRAIRHADRRRKKMRANTRKRLRAIRRTQREAFLDTHGAAKRGRAKKAENVPHDSARRTWRY